MPGGRIHGDMHGNIQECGSAGKGDGIWQKTRTCRLDAGK